MPKWKLIVVVGTYTFRKYSLCKRTKDMLKEKIGNICKRIKLRPSLVIRGGDKSIWVEVKWMFSAENEMKANVRGRRRINDYVAPVIKKEGLCVIRHELRKIEQKYY